MNLSAWGMPILKTLFRAFARQLIGAKIETLREECIYRESLAFFHLVFCMTLLQNASGV